ncbi:hypothetical protein DBR12_13605 [Acidovorax sp. HMWF029]|uniref:class I SAM-dependent methyltransferase n=1 Tax=Acidovorax sp. TaxID=1872122 RepID=UPI000D36785F|nr:class I SAM-dependent methyltransferase [Acidovorax sp.]MDH4418059.1 class I SAM-dependent methyltransferase [Acidovorax sp.]PTT19012.1 hypothetical protein DBR12_13605 [Acidovorax sp. HMWF029]
MKRPHQKLNPASETAWEPSEIEVLGQCPICQSKDRNVLHESLTDTLFGCAPGRWALHACSACNTAYIDPRPTEDSIGKAYAEYCTHPERESDAFDQNLSTVGISLLSSARAILNGYRNSLWQMGLTPSNSYGRYLVALIPPVRALIDQQMRHMPRQASDKQGRLLDVGCGNGSFLKLAQKAGWSVHGIDFDPIAVAEARKGGMDIYLGSIEQLEAQEGTYDWITCSHVLEHVHDPQNLLQSMYRLLRPGGILWLQTPNIESIGYRAYGTSWIGIDPPRHLTLMSIETLHKTLENSGFRTIFRRLPVISAMAVYAASNALKNGEKNAIGLPHTRIFRLRFLLLAVIQNLSLRHTEFHTAIATRPK